MARENLNMFNSGYSIEMYRIIEDDFVDFISYVPLEENHLKVYSPKLADIIIRCCNQIEAFFKEWLMLPSLDHLEQIEIYRSKINIKKGPRLKIEDYKYFFKPRLRLSEHCLFVPTLDKYISPFEEFNSEGKAPSWWTVHNNLKHHAFENRKEATLEVALYAISALFYLNRSNSITTHGLQSILERCRVLICEGYPPFIESLEK
jgi:hypothetical protein